MQENKCGHHIGREKKEALSVKPVKLFNNIPILIMLWNSGILSPSTQFIPFVDEFMFYFVHFSGFISYWFYWFEINVKSCREWHCVQSVQ